jgi:single-stranded-DNA-specific exonuclease
MIGMSDEKTLFSKNRERWKLTQVETDDVTALAKALDIDILLAKLLLSRNIGNGDIEQIKDFLNPSDDLVTDYSKVTTPEQLELGIERVVTAIKNQEKIIINGDPDADGISGVTILATALRHMGADITYDFPVRAREGHGLQVRIIEECIENGVSLIISTDCGSKDIDAAAYAKEKGIDVIITDHHILGKTLPDVYSLINPQLVEGPSLFKELSGSGVAFKFILAIADRLEREMPETFIEFLLAVLSFGTLSDRMSLLNPMNRVLISRGVEALKTTNREGLKAIRRVCIDERSEIKARNLSRTIIPRLNAPGRIGDKDQGIPDSSIVVDLLTIGVGQKHAKKARELAQIFQSVVDLNKKKRNEMLGNAMSTALSVDDINEKRKYITNKIEEEIGELVESQCDVTTDRILMVEGQNWNPGVIGIDTDRLKDRYLRPAILFTTDSTDYIRASVRSIPTINMYKLIDEIDEEFLNKNNYSMFQCEVVSEKGTRKVNAFGGHSQACGFTLHKDNLAQFKDMVREKAKELQEEDFDYSYEIIEKIPFSDIGTKLINKLDDIMPYGQCFDYPIFYLKECDVVKGKPFGNKYQSVRQSHVRFSVKEYDAQRGKGKSFPAVGFGLWEKFCDLKAGPNPTVGYDLIFTCEKIGDNRRGEGDVRLNVLDIRISGQDNLSLDV